MSTPRKYYWMKLKESFMTSDTIDFFMSQPDGANYVVLYQALCLKTINTEGRLSRQIGEAIIPFDIPKIQRDCKWFSADTIRIALELYKKFGLIYEDVDGTLVLTDHKNLVGSETSYAQQKRNQREKKNLLKDEAKKEIAEQSESGQEGGQGGGHVHSNVHPDIRDKSIEIDIDKDIDNSTHMSKPTHISERGDYLLCSSSIEKKAEKKDTPAKRENAAAAFEELTLDDADIVINAWSELDIPGKVTLKPYTKRWGAVNWLCRNYGMDAILKAIHMVGESDHLMGRKPNSTWRVTFDWFIDRDNFAKVLDGNYSQTWTAPPPNEPQQRSGTSNLFLRYVEEHQNDEE